MLAIPHTIPKSRQAATRNRGKATVNSPLPTYNQEPDMDNTSRINRGTRYDNQKAFNVAGDRENVGVQVVQQYGIQCYNCKEYGHVARECQERKQAKDSAYHKEKMLLCDTNITTDLVDMSTNGEEADKDDDDLARERDLLASLIEKLKCEIDDSKNYNKLLESSNKTLVDKLKSKIEDFKNKN
ncbi:retrovirus-related pol polyprotein from transposon TNT 1-94 [Tanacetum coccineum]